MLIPEHKIQEVLERVDLVALVSRHVSLKKSGRNWVGLCPFHHEKTPSFQVTASRGFFCFGCQAGGNAISFVQRYLGKTFVDAVRDLAREAGVDLETAEDPGARERQQLREVTDFAAEHFKSRLWDPEAGRAARQYLASRGVTDEVARVFGLGLAPAAWSELADKLTAAGLLDFGALAGLVAKRQKTDGYYDMFRGRLIVPIRTPEGRTIAFGGRLLESAASASAGTEAGPKYLNSRESRLYSKSDTLYGLDQARDEIHKRKSAVLVEGYFDCIGMHQVGVKHAVALCSTALTAGHLALLARCEAKELVLLLDGDEAGRKAVERLAGSILAAGASAKVALLPDGEDPDTFARRAGPEGVRALLASARTLTQHLFATVLPDGREASFEAKMGAIDRIKPIAAQLPVGLFRSAFFEALASHSGLPAAELEASLRAKAQPPRPVPKPSASLSIGRSFVSPRPNDQAAERAPDALEAYFAALALKDRRLLERDSQRAGDQLVHLGLRSVLAQLSAGQSPEEALFEASPLMKGALEAAAKKLPAEGELERAFAATCQKLKVRRIEEQLSHIARVTASLEGANELTEETRRLLAERSELLALKRKVLDEPR